MWMARSPGRRPDAILILLALLAGVTPASSAPIAIKGDVRDGSGAAIVGADVVILTGADIEVARVTSDAAGAFEAECPEATGCVVVVQARGFAGRRTLVRPSDLGASAVVVLEPQGVTERVTVTPMPGASQTTLETPRHVTTLESGELASRLFVTLPEAMRGLVGVSVQQTSTSQGSPFVRGMTGQHVVTLLDGVRFNTGTFRPGANQYLAFIDPNTVDRIEVMHGPSSVEYGSDALGGTIQVVSRRAGGGGDHFGVQGGGAVTGSSADRLASATSFVTGGVRGWSFLLDASASSAGDRRAGGGDDSRSVATRLLGLPSSVLGSRLNQTGFRQTGTTAKVAIRPTTSDAFSAQYIRGEQRGASRYDQLDGGLGNLVHFFDPQTLDFAVVRYDRVGLGVIDTLSARVSMNQQRDDRAFQNVNNNRAGLLSARTDERNRTRVFGYQVTTASIWARHAVSLGAELYDERVDAQRLDRRYDPLSGGFDAGVPVRARFPDGAGYRTVGLFVQDGFALLPDRLHVSLGGRYSGYAYSQPASGTTPAAMVPAFETAAGQWTGAASVVLRLREGLVATAGVNRGFRAPNVNDFGSIGVSGAGFEVSPEEGVRLGGRSIEFGAVGLDGARRVETLRPESLTSYEVGLRAQGRRVSGTVSAFHADVTDFITRSVLVLDPAPLGTLIGGQPMTRQDALGATYTSLASTPVFVRTNGGHLRMRGVEGTVDVSVTSTLSAHANVAAVRGTDVATGRAPGLENGIPPLHGYASLRWQPRKGRASLEAYTMFAASQGRLSGNDLAQARIGGMRTADEIRNFFNNGAVARGLVSQGVLSATGETADQVIVRVLGPSRLPSPMYTAHPGFWTLNLRAGWRAASWSTVLFAENLLDRNYRIMGSGVDAQGFNVGIRQSVTF